MQMKKISLLKTMSKMLTRQTSLIFLLKKMRIKVKNKNSNNLLLRSIRRLGNNSKLILMITVVFLNVRKVLESRN